MKIHLLSLHFLHFWCTSPLTAHDSLTDSSWPVKVGGSQEEEDEEAKSDGETRGAGRSEG